MIKRTQVIQQTERSVWNASITNEKPKPVATSPISITEVIDGGFAAIRQRPISILGSSAIFLVPANLLLTWSLGTDFGYGAMSKLFEGTISKDALSLIFYTFPIILSFLLLTLGGVASWVAINKIVANWLVAKDLPLKDALKYAGSRIIPTTIIALIVVVIIGILGIISIGIGGFLIAPLFLFAVPVCAIEGLGPIASLKRSFQLSKSHYGRGLVFILLMLLVSLPFIILNNSLDVEDNNLWIVYEFFKVILSLTVWPIFSAITCIYYLDLRYRSEGLDLQVRKKWVFND